LKIDKVIELACCTSFFGTQYILMVHGFCTAHLPSANVNFVAVAGSLTTTKNHNQATRMMMDSLVKMYKRREQIRHTSEIADDSLPSFAEQNLN